MATDRGPSAPNWARFGFVASPAAVDFVISFERAVTTKGRLVPSSVSCPAISAARLETAWANVRRRSRRVQTSNSTTGRPLNSRDATLTLHNQSHLTFCCLYLLSSPSCGWTNRFRLRRSLRKGSVTGQLAYWRPDHPFLITRPLHMQGSSQLAIHPRPSLVVHGNSDAGRFTLFEYPSHCLLLDSTATRVRTK